MLLDRARSKQQHVRHKDSDVGIRQVYFFLACGDAFDVLTCSGFPCAGFRQRSKSNPRGSHCCGVLVLVQGFGMFRVLVWLARFRLSDLSFTDWIRSCAPLRYRFSSTLVTFGASGATAWSRCFGHRSLPWPRSFYADGPGFILNPARPPGSRLLGSGPKA